MFAEFLPPGLGAARDPLILRASFLPLCFLLETQPGESRSGELGFLPASAWGLHLGMGASQH